MSPLAAPRALEVQADEQPSTGSRHTDLAPLTPQQEAIISSTLGFLRSTGGTHDLETEERSIRELLQSINSRAGPDSDAQLFRELIAGAGHDDIFQVMVPGGEPSDPSTSRELAQTDRIHLDTWAKRDVEVANNCFQVYGNGDLGGSVGTVNNLNLTICANLPSQSNTELQTAENNVGFVSSLYSLASIPGTLLLVSALHHYSPRHQYNEYMSKWESTSKAYDKLRDLSGDNFKNLLATEIDEVQTVLAGYNSLDWQTIEAKEQFNKLSWHARWLGGLYCSRYTSKALMHIRQARETLDTYHDTLVRTSKPIAARSKPLPGIPAVAGFNAIPMEILSLYSTAAPLSEPPTGSTRSGAPSANTISATNGAESLGILEPPNVVGQA